ncbi:hypothetical protein LP419_02375 [Massilia sp. H-1]|nr:hypothetical protein LP419_02375 [Massilia sp. H-1]
MRSKLILMALATTFVALLSASIAMLLYDLRTFQRYWVDDLMTQADIIASVTALGARLQRCQDGAAEPGRAARAAANPG